MYLTEYTLTVPVWYNVEIPGELTPAITDCQRHIWRKPQFPHLQETWYGSIQSACNASSFRSLTLTSDRRCKDFRNPRSRSS